MKYLFVALVFLNIDVSGQQSKPTSMAAIEFRQPDSLRAAQFCTEVIISNATHGFYGLMFSKGLLVLDKKKNVSSLVFKLKDEVVSVAKLVSIGLNVDTSKPGRVTWKYDWAIGSSYKLLVTALADSASQSTQYAGYVFLDREQQWKYLATWQIIHDGRWLQQPSLVLGTQKRQSKIGMQKLSLQQGWLQRNNGSWKTLTEGVYVANLKGGIDTDSGRLFIAGEPFVMGSASSGVTIHATAVNVIPIVAVTNNIDSMQQSAINKAKIVEALQQAGADTSLHTNNVYYTMLKEGSGNFVSVTDTVTVFYKGSLLKDGSVFDATKDKPATFPLNRLIKGWQYALVKCKVGGKVRLYIPSGLAYATRLRSKNIPPNSILVFDIEVVEARN